MINEWVITLCTLQRLFLFTVFTRWRYQHDNVFYLVNLPASCKTFVYQPTVQVSCDDNENIDITKYSIKLPPTSYYPTLIGIFKK